MKLLDKTLHRLIKQKTQSSCTVMSLDQLNGLVLNKMNLGSIAVNMNLLKNIQFLSLKNNFLSNIDFILQLPQLFYLDISKNSIEDFQPLNIKSSFGYLKFTIGQFVEKRLLLLKGMTIGILDIDIINRSLFKQVLFNNPNIIVLNQEIIYFYDKFLQNEVIRDTKRHRSLLIIANTRKELTSSLLKHEKCTPLENNPIQVEMNRTNDINSHHSNKSSSTLTANTNNEIKKLNSFFEYYNSTLHSIISNMNNSLCSTHLSLEEQYIDIERLKLKLLADINNHIHQLKNQKESILIGRINDQISDCDEILETDKLKIDDIQKQLIILILFLLQMTQTITSSLSIEVINHILLHFNTIKGEGNKLLNQHSFNSNYLLSFYVNLYDDLIERYEKHKNESIHQLQSNFQYEKYKVIIQSLKMNSLVLKGNYINDLYINSNFTPNVNTESSIQTDNRQSIKSKMTILTNLKLDNSILIMIQFVSDFVHLNKIDKLLTENSLSDYSSMNELKEYLYHSSSAKLCLSLSDKKYQHLKLSHLSNRYYLSKENAYHRNKTKPDDEAIQIAKKLTEGNDSNNNYSLYYNTSSNHSRQKKRMYITMKDESDPNYTDSKVKLKSNNESYYKIDKNTNNTANISRLNMIHNKHDANNSSLIHNYKSRSLYNNLIKLRKNISIGNKASTKVKVNQLNNSDQYVNDGLKAPRNENTLNMKSMSANPPLVISKPKYSYSNIKKNNIKDINDLTELNPSFLISSNCFISKHPILYQLKSKKASLKKKTITESFLSHKELMALVRIRRINQHIE